MSDKNFDFFDFDEWPVKPVKDSQKDSTNDSVTMKCPQCHGQRRCVDSFGNWNECGKCDGAGYYIGNKPKPSEDVPF